MYQWLSGVCSSLLSRVGAMCLGQYGRSEGWIAWPRWHLVDLCGDFGSVVLHQTAGSGHHRGSSVQGPSVDTRRLSTSPWLGGSSLSSFRGRPVRQSLAACTGSWWPTTAMLRCSVRASRIADTYRAATSLSCSLSPASSALSKYVSSSLGKTSGIELHRCPVQWGNWPDSVSRVSITG